MTGDADLAIATFSGANADGQAGGVAAGQGLGPAENDARIVEIEDRDVVVILVKTAIAGGTFAKRRAQILDKIGKIERGDAAEQQLGDGTGDRV